MLEMHLARWQQWPISAVSRHGGGFIFNDNDFSFSMVGGTYVCWGEWWPASAALGQSRTALAPAGSGCSLSGPRRSCGWGAALGLGNGSGVSGGWAAAPGIEKTSMKLKLSWESRTLGAPVIRPLGQEFSSHVLHSSFLLRVRFCAAFHSISRGAHELSVTHAPCVPREYISRHNGAHLNSVPSVSKTWLTLLSVTAMYALRNLPTTSSKCSMLKSS